MTALCIANCPRCHKPADPLAMYQTRFDRYAFAVSCSDLKCLVCVPFHEDGTPLEQVVDEWNHGVGLLRGMNPWRKPDGQAEQMRVVEVNDKWM